MSEGTVEGYQGSDSDSGSDNSGGLNHSWDPVLNLIPEEAREQAKPYFQQWDQGVQQKIQGLQQQYDPWKPFIEGGVDPQDAQYSIGLLNALQEDPQKVWNAIGQHYGFNSKGEVVPVADDVDGGAKPNQAPPELENLQKTVATMADIILREQQAKEQAAQDAALDKRLTDLKKKYGEYDEDYVLGKMQAGWDAEDAVKSYQQFVDRLMNGSRPEPPRVFGSGGAIPTAGGVDVAKLNRPDTKKLVADMLRKAQSG